MEKLCMQQRHQTHCFTMHNLSNFWHFDPAQSEASYSSMHEVIRAKLSATPPYTLTYLTYMQNRTQRHWC